MTARVLIVDDDRAMCSLIKAGLARDDFDVTWRTRAEEAFDLLKDADFDVVVTDLNMRGMNGLELCERVVANRPDVPVIVLTAFGSLETAVRAIRAGAYDFLTKPFQIAALRIAVERGVQHRRLRDELDLVQQFEGVHYTGAFGDLDNDGDLDLYITGERGDFVEGVFVNDGAGRYTLLPKVVLGVGNDPRAAVFADLNNDGRLDLAVASKQGPNTVFLNHSRRSSSVQLDLVSPDGEAGALGARVRLYEAGHVGDPGYLRGMREVRGATGYCAQEPPRVHFGVDALLTYDAEILFVGGTVVRSTNLRAGIHLVDGRPKN